LNTQGRSYQQKFRFDNPKVHSIYKQLQNQSQPVFEEFKQHTMDLVIQNMIRHENPKLDSVLDRLSNILIAVMKSQNREFGVWHTSQPYQRTVSLKYSMTTYEEFLLELHIIFQSNDLDIPREELEYLESVRLKLEHLQKQAEMSAFNDKIHTCWNWGQGLIKHERDIKNTGVMLRSPINFGVKSMRSAIQGVSFSSLDFRFFIFLFWGIILLSKYIKFKL
jgi:hypothetical protein